MFEVGRSTRNVSAGGYDEFLKNIFSKWSENRFKLTYIFDYPNHHILKNVLRTNNIDKITKVFKRLYPNNVDKNITEKKLMNVQSYQFL